MGSIGANTTNTNVSERTLESYGGLRSFINRYPYSNESNPIDDKLRLRLESSAEYFDSNIKPYYSRKENIISIGISGLEREYDLSAKNGNEFKKMIQERIESSGMGLEVEKMGKARVDGLPEFWFRVRPIK